MHHPLFLQLDLDDEKKLTEYHLSFIACYGLA